MWSAPGMNNPLNAKNTQLCLPHLSFGSGMSTARHHDSDGEQMREDEEDPELARKRKQLHEIEEQILFKKALLFQKQSNMFQDDAASCEVRDKRVVHNTPDTSGIHDFAKLSNEDGGRAFFCHKGASLRDRVNTVLQQKHTADYFTKLQLKKAKETMNSLSQSKDGFTKENHPLRRRVHQLMRRMLNYAREIPANREVAGITETPPTQSLHPAVQESIIANDGFERFLTVLNQGVDINILSKIVSDDTEDLPLRDDQSPVVEKSDLSYRTKSRDKSPSPHGIQWQDHRQTNKAEPASREQSNKKRISKANEKKDYLGSSPFTTKGAPKSDEEKDREGHLGSLPFINNGLSMEDEMKDTRSHLGSRPFAKNRLCETDAKNEKEGHMGVGPSNNKGISKVYVRNEREDHFHSSSQSQFSPSSSEGIYKADEKKWSVKMPSDIEEQWQDHRHTNSAERKTELARMNENKDTKGHIGSTRQSPSIHKRISKADEKDRRVSLSCNSPSQSSPYKHKGILKAVEKKDKEDYISFRNTSCSSATVDHLEKLDTQQEHLQNILKTIGLNLESEEMNRLADRTRERLYGKKTDDRRLDNSRQEQEFKQRSPKRRRSSSSSSSNSDSYRNLGSSSSDSEEQGQSSDSSSSSRNIPTFQESKQVQQGILRDQDRVGFKDIPSHHPHTESQIYSIPLSNKLTNYDMPQYSQNPPAGSNIDTSPMINHDLSISEGQTGMVSHARCIQTINSQHHGNLAIRGGQTKMFPRSRCIQTINIQHENDLAISEGQTGIFPRSRCIQTINTQHDHYPSISEGQTGMFPRAHCMQTINTHHDHDLSIRNCQTGILSSGHSLQDINTQHNLTKGPLIMIRPSFDWRNPTQLRNCPMKRKRKKKKKKKIQINKMEKKLNQIARKCKISDMEVPEVTDEMVLDSKVLKVKEQSICPGQEDKGQPTRSQLKNKRQPPRPQQEDKRQPPQPQNEDKWQPTRPQPEDKRHTNDQKQLKEEEIRENLKRKLEVFNQMAKERCMTPRNSLT